MKITKRVLVSLVLVLTVCVSMLGGCSRRLTPKKIMTSMAKNMKDITSFSNTVEADIKMEDVLHVTEVAMDMTMEHTMKPKAGHAAGTANVNVRGIKLASSLEIYQVIEDEEYVTYSSIDGIWSREASKEEQTSGLTFDGSLFQRMGDTVESFRIAEETIQLDGRECYQMYGDVTGEDLMGLLGTEMLHAYGLVELPDEDAIAELTIPLTFDVYKEEMLPARIIVDMTDVMNELYDEFNETMNVNDFTVELGFTEYNTVEEIVVPETVKGKS